MIPGSVRVCPRARIRRVRVSWHAQCSAIPHAEWSMSSHVFERHSSQLYHYCAATVSNVYITHNYAPTAAFNRKLATWLGNPTTELEGRRSRRSLRFPPDLARLRIS
eukprot:2538820-Rhodomonas_salina.1